MAVRIVPSLEQLVEGLVRGGAVRWQEKQPHIILLETSKITEAEPRSVTICDLHHCPFNASSSNSLDNPLGKIIEALLGLGAFLGDRDPAIIQSGALGGEQPGVQSLPSVVDLWVILMPIQPVCTHQTDILCMIFSYYGRC